MLAKRTLMVVIVMLAATVGAGMAPARGQGGGGMGGSGGGMGGGGMGGGGMGGGGSGSTVIDPPVSGPFVEPATLTDMNADPMIVEVDLDARLANVDVGGTMAQLMTYNGTFPGPTIRVRPGNMLMIHFTNNLPPTTQTNLLGYRRNVTNLHTHGLHVSPEEPADYVMYELYPGETRHHVYDLMMQPGGTLSFYHGHKHGVSAEQYWSGMVGALVTEDDVPALAPYETHLVILKDMTIENGLPAPHSSMMDYMHGKEGNVVMVNGRVNPRLTIERNEVQRWRILNASNARFYRLALDSHTFQLVGTDGGLLDKPYARSELLLAPGERVDVLVKASASSGSYRLRALPYTRMGNMQSPTITLMTVTYSGRRDQSLPATVNPSAVRLDPSGLMIAARRTLSLSMGQGNGYINGQDFDVNPYTIMSELGTYELWTIVNQSGMDHPFHQHINEGQVVAISGGDAGYRDLYTKLPGWKDTVLIPKWGSVTILIPIHDYSGMAMFHCHILEHEDIGMMGMWHIMGGMPMPMASPSDPATAASKVGPEPARNLSATVFPNPFNPTTTIRFSLPEAMSVSAEVWSVSGARVRVLADGRPFAAGANALAWDGTDERGIPLGSGVYFVRLRTRVGDSVTRAVLFK